MQLRALPNPQALSTRAATALAGKLSSNAEWFHLPLTEVSYMLEKHPHIPSETA